MQKQLLAIGLAVLVGGATGEAVRAQSTPAKAASPAGKPSALEASLQRRALARLNARRDLLMTCRECNGNGYVDAYPYGKLTHPKCTACAGGGKQVSPTKFKKYYADFRSPNWQLRDGAQRDVDQECAKLTIDEARKYAATAPHFDHVELVDPTHGIAYVTEGMEKFPRSSQWILVTAGRNPPDWYCWTPDIDGTWPEARKPAPQDPAPEPPAPPETPAPSGTKAVIPSPPAAPKSEPAAPPAPGAPSLKS